MKLPHPVSLVALVPVIMVVHGQQSQPDCKNWTQTQLFDKNPALLPTETKYIELMAGTLESNCIDDVDDLQNCDIKVGQSDLGDNYTQECNAVGGTMWEYDFSPKCDNSVEQKIAPVLVCASSECLEIGVANLIPHPGLLDPFIARNYTCATGFKITSGGGSTFGFVSKMLLPAVVVALSAYLTV